MSNTTTDVVGERPSGSGAPNARGKVVNPIKALQGFGQSVWLDYLRRSLFTSGEFSRLIDRRVPARAPEPDPPRRLFRNARLPGDDHVDADGVGLGRMDASMVRRLMRGGHECVVYEVNADAVARLVNSPGQADFADQLPLAMRYQFGGHLEKGRTAGSAGKRDAS